MALSSDALSSSSGILLDENIEDNWELLLSPDPASTDARVISVAASALSSSEDVHGEASASLEDCMVSLILAEDLQDKFGQTVIEEQARKVASYVLRRFDEGVEQLERVPKAESALDFPVMLAPDHTAVILTGHKLASGRFKTIYDALLVRLGDGNQMSVTRKVELRVRSRTSDGKLVEDAIPQAERGDDLAGDIGSDYVIAKSDYRLRYTRVSPYIPGDLHRLMMITDKMDHDLRSLDQNQWHYSQKQLVAIARDAACGLRDLHKKNLIHRDVKVDNVLVVAGRARLGDLDFCVSSQQVPETLKGTGLYLAPEVIMQKDDLGSRKAQTQAGDNWALGALLYRLFHPEHKEPVFLRNLVRLRELEARLRSLEQKPGLVRLFPDWKPKDAQELSIQRLISGLLMKDPEKRLSAASAARQLKAIYKRL